MKDEEKYDKLGKWQKAKLMKLGIKLYGGLCKECRTTIQQKIICDECMYKNRKTLDKLHNLTGERYGV